MVPHNLEGDSELRSVLEAQILHHRETVYDELHRIAAKSRLLNDLLPISKLPPEVVAEVFVFFAFNPRSYRKANMTDPYPGPYRWIMVTHVCHRWREVALNYPKLWSEIHLESPAGVEVFLARSGDETPLDIRTWDFYPVNNSGRYMHRSVPSSIVTSLRLVLTQLHRIQHLRLAVHGAVLERAFIPVNATGFNAALLRSLTFLGSDYQPFPNILTTCKLPSLTRVEFQGYTSLWHLPFLRATTLKELFIESSSTRPSDHPSIPHLLRAVSCMPMLQSLVYLDEFCDGLCMEDEGSYGVLPYANLPCLRSLEIRLDILAIYTFITHCKFPSSAHVDLKANVSHEHTMAQTDEPQEGSPHLVCSVLSRVLDASGSVPPITGISIYFHDAPCSSVQVSIMTYHDDLSSFPRLVNEVLPPPCFKIEYSFRKTQQSYQMLHSTLLHIPLSNVVYMNIDCRPISPYLDEEAFGRLLLEFFPPALQTLQISGQTWSTLYHLLESSESSYLPEATPELPKPSLFQTIRTLILAEERDFMPLMWGGRFIPYIDLCCTIIRSEAVRCKWRCGPFSQLVLQRSISRRDSLLELVDSVSELFDQEGRFTQNLSRVPFVPHSYDPSPPTLPPLLGVLLPDPDFGEPPWDPTMDCGEGDWLDHILQGGRVTFDFRGDPGILIEKNID